MDYEKTLAFQLLQKFEGYRAEIERLSFVVEMCPIPVAIAGADGTVVHVNSAYKKTFGRDITRMQGDDWQSLYAPHEGDRLKRWWTEFIASKTPSTTDTAYVCPETGSFKNVRISLVPVPDDGIIVFLLPETCWTLVPPAGLSPAT